MPKVKNKRQYTKTYTEEALQQALEDIKGGLSQKKAAVKYGIPRQTLQFRLGDKFKKTGHGPPSYLTKDEEKLLEDWVLESYRKGFPRRRQDIQASVKSFLDNNPRKTPFVENAPGKNWFKAFLRRHPQLTSRIPESVTSASSNVSEEDIRSWFRNIEAYLKEKNYFSILQDPERVYNGDETCFLLCPEEDKVLAARGARNVYQVEQGTAKSNLTVMFTFSASGSMTPPMIIYPYKRLPSSIVNSIPSNWGVGLSDNGWMKSELFFEYVSNVLHPYLLKQNVEFPVILFVDGHKTHLTYALSTLCSSLKIILIALYPNSTRILQPADVSCFRPLKNSWKTAVHDWRRRNPLVQLTKLHFAPILQEAVKSLKPTTIVNGFRASGLFPWNVDAIDFSKCLGKRHSNPDVSSDHLEHEDDRSLTYTDFVRIVGSEKLKQLEVYDKLNTEQLSEDFKALVEIFHRLKPNESAIVSQNGREVIDVESDFSQTDIENMPIHFVEDSENTMNLSAPIPEISPFDIVTCLNVVNNETTILNTEFSVITQFETTEQLVNDMPELGGMDNEGDNNLSVTSNVSKNEADDGSSRIETDSRDLVQFLQWPKTPERKGKRQTEKLPYVLTSTGWKKIYEEKEAVKNAKEQQKEENRLKRLQKKKEKVGKKQKTVTKTKSSPLKENYKRTKPNNAEMPEEAVKRSTHMMSKVKHRESEAKPSYVKNLTTELLEDSPPSFPPENDEKMYSGFAGDGCSEYESVTSSASTSALSKLPTNNIIQNKGLCFLCAGNVSILRFAIQCQKCTRQYHFKCLVDRNLYTETFLCKVCIEKL